MCVCVCNEKIYMVYIYDKGIDDNTHMQVVLMWHLAFTYNGEHYEKGLKDCTQPKEHIISVLNKVNPSHCFHGLSR